MNSKSIDIAVPDFSNRFLIFTLIVGILFWFGAFHIASGQDHVRLNAKFLKSKSSKWGLVEVPKSKSTLDKISTNDYYVFHAKDKSAEKRSYFYFKESQLEMSEDELPDSLRCKITVGFYGLKLQKEGFSPVYQTDNLCSLAKVFEDMAFNGEATIWHPGSVKDLKIYVYPDASNDDSLTIKKENHSNFLYVLQNMEIYPRANTSIGTPIDSLELMRNGIMVHYFEPLKADMQFAGYEKLTGLGFELKDKIRPSISQTSRGLWVNQSTVDIADNPFFDGPAIVGNMPILKASQIPESFLKDDIFSLVKGHKFELKNLEFETYAPLEKKKLVTIPPTDTIVKPAISDLLENQMETKLDVSRSRFYMDSALAGVYVTGFSNDGLKPEYMYLPFFQQTYFIDFEARGFLDENIVNHLLDSIQIELLGTPVTINKEEILFKSPAIFKESPHFDISLTGYKNVVEVDLEQKSPTNLMVYYSPIGNVQQEQVNSEVTVEQEKEKTTVIYLDIAELNNKRILQYYLQENLDSLTKGNKKYLLFLSNGSNPIVDSYHKGAYMDVIKKISFLYPETASPRSDKNKLVEHLIKEEIPTENMDVYFFLSPVSYNRFKDYMINELKIQYQCDVTIIVESIDNQRIDPAYKHIDLTEKSK